MTLQIQKTKRNDFQIYQNVLELLQEKRTASFVNINARMSNKYAHHILNMLMKADYVRPILTACPHTKTGYTPMYLITIGGLSFLEILHKFNNNTTVAKSNVE